MKTRLALGISAITGVLTSCASLQPAPPSTAIDHIVLAISNLERGIEQLGEVCGLTPVRGGTHDHTGTENALLGMDLRAYLEVLAPREGVELPPRLQPLRGVMDLLPVSWAVSVANAELAADMLREYGYTVTEPTPGSRQAADGSIIRWRTLEIVTPKIEGAPFLIEWDRASAHPAATSPAGCPLVSLEVHTPQDEALRRLLGLLNVQGQVLPADAHRMVVTLRGSRGPVRLPRGR